MVSLSISDVVTTEWSKPIKGRFGFKVAYLMLVGDEKCH